MKILVTGVEGQVVRSLIERAADQGVVVEAAGRPRLDLGDPASIARTIQEGAPDIVVSAAAYTAVDQAEDEPERAFALNAMGAGAVAKAARSVGAPVIHLSTDYVFSGGLGRPYREDDNTDPQGVYGRSKLEGERAVADANPRHIILRTAWVYSPFGRNFVKTMLNLARDREEVRVVSDQYGNPTSAWDIADGILHMAKRLHADAGAPCGVFHIAGTGDTNWSGLAAHVFAVSQGHGGPHARVVPIRTEEYPTKARRPADSRLNTGKLLSSYGWQAPEWKMSVAEVVRKLVEDTRKT